MEDHLNKICDLFKRAKDEEASLTEDTFNYDILNTLSISVIVVLRSRKSDVILRLIFKIFPKLQELMDNSVLVRSILKKAGHLPNLAIICREICFDATSLPTYIEQQAYIDALQEFPFSGFPILIARLPEFLELHLNKKYINMQNGNIEAAAADEAKN